MLNVLVTALSLYGKNDSEHRYTYKANGKEYIVTGTHTNEPVPKALSLCLKEQGKQLDKIIILCTPAVLKPLDGCVSSLERFKQTLSNYFETQSEDLFECIAIPDMPDSAQLFSASLQIVDSLKKLLPNVSVYLDSTGGFRDAMMSIISTMQLLKDSGIQVADVFYTVFDRDRTEPYEIVSRKESYSVYELVSGMDELRKYGNVSRLLGVFADRGVTNPQQRILDALADVYTELQLCRVEQSKNALLRLNVLLSSYCPDGSVFDTVVSTAKEKYEGIGETTAYEDYIKWYYEHGYVAQTLAFFYETLPDIFSQKGILKAGKDLQLQYSEKINSLVERRKWNYFFINTYFKEHYDPAKVAVAEAREQIELLINDSVKNLTKDAESLKEAVEFAVALKKDSRLSKNTPKSYKNLIYVLEQANINNFNSEEMLLGKKNAKSIYNTIKSNPAIIKPLFSIDIESDKDTPEGLADLIVSSIDGVDSIVNPNVDITTLKALLTDYFYLKDQRNSVLHVETRSASPDVLDERIKMAIKRLDTVITQCKR